MLSKKVTKVLPAESGVALIQAIFMAFVLLSLAYGAYYFSTVSYEKRRDLDVQEELKNIRKLLIDYMDCRQTLQVGAQTPVPLQCDANRVYLPKYRNGEDITNKGHLGKYPFANTQGQQGDKWDIRARCRDGQSIVIERRLLTQSQKLKEAFSRGKDDWQPLFVQDPLLCREYFISKRNSCSVAAYPVYAGADDTGPVCCRVQQASSLAGAVSASCNAQEYVYAGGGLCARQLAEVPPTAEAARTLVRRKGQCKVGKILCALIKSQTSHVTDHGYGYPSVESHAHSISPGVGQASGVVRRIWGRETRDGGGFLVRNQFEVGAASRVVSGWSAQCRRSGSEQTRFDDWRGDFFTTAMALCCPKKAIRK